MSELPYFDFHIHTHHLKCANDTMQIEDIVRVCTGLGLTAIGITDHLNRLEQLGLHEVIREEILALEPEIDIFFGVEVNDIGLAPDFEFPAEVKEKTGFQFAIGGIHGTYSDTYDLARIIDNQHRQHLAICNNPLVDVLVHPYWFSRGEYTSKEWPWFDSMKPVPHSYARELGQAAKESGTAIEINGSAVISNSNYSERFVAEYAEFLAVIAETGARFSIASDAHDINSLATTLDSRKIAEKIGLTPESIWMPGGKPLVGPGARK